MYKCFACGEPIYNLDLPCPKCGYKFDAGEDKYCPNSNFGLCSVTEIPCTFGLNWNICRIKNKVDNESGI